MTKIYSTLTEKFAIKTLLDEHLTLVPSDTYLGEEDSTLYRYDSDWSDLRISQAVHERLTAANTYSVRKEFFGELASHATARSTKAAHEARLTKLECQFHRLLDYLMHYGALNAQDHAIILGNTDTNGASVADFVAPDD